MVTMQQHFTKGTVPTFALGYDGGNSETKAVLILPGTERRAHIKFPSFTAPGSLPELARKRSMMGNQFQRDEDCLGSDEYVLRFNQGEVFVGSLATNEGGVDRLADSGRGAITRYWSLSSLQRLLVASAKMLKPTAGGITTYRLIVATGLPIESLTPGNRSKVREALESPWTVDEETSQRVQRDPYAFSVNGREYRAYVRVSHVIVEGAGGGIAYGDKVPTARQAVIDIGGRTTDVYIFRGQKPDQGSGGRAIGVENVGDLVSSWFEAKYRRPLKASERYDLLHAYADGGEMPLLYARNEQVSQELLLQWTEAAIEQILDQITSFISEKLNSSEQGDIGGDFSRVTLIGGGAHFFAPRLIALMPRLYIPEQDPEFGNALGYALLAEQAVLKEQQAQASAAQRVTA